VEQVGERQQRLLRELETLALEGGRGDSGPRVVTVEDVQLRAAHSSERAAYALADALVGRDGRAALALYLRLRAQGESDTGLIYRMVQRLRDALEASLALAGGQSAAEIRRGLRMPQKAAERFMADVARTDPERLRSALVVMADLELDTRGGAPLRSRRGTVAGATAETRAVRAIQSATS
jgi:DNA polymerase-3 subunit delta